MLCTVLLFVIATANSAAVAQVPSQEMQLNHAAAVAKAPLVLRQWYKSFGQIDSAEFEVTGEYSVVEKSGEAEFRQ